MLIHHHTSSTDYSTMPPPRSPVPSRLPVHYIFTSISVPARLLTKNILIPRRLVFNLRPSITLTRAPNTNFHLFSSL
ncbi:hypothetical protein M3J09_008564 [Ascochyta lentis]